MKLHLDSFHPRPEGRGFSESLAKGEVSDVKNVTDSADEREFKLNNGDVFNYSKELENLITDTQNEEDLDVKLIEN